MSEQTQANHPIYSLLPAEVEGFDSLVKLALDMRWSLYGGETELRRPGS